MAKKVKSEKVYLASVNWGSLLFGLILTVLACYAYSFLMADMSIGYVSMTTLSDPAFLENLEAYMTYQPIVIPQMFFLAFLSIFQLIALINVVRLVIGTLGFFGKKDSRKMAMKLAKHAKIAFAVMGTAVALPTIASLDDGALPEGMTTLYVVAGVAAGLYYLLVRYYRWFVVEKKSVTEWVFPLVRDIGFFAIPVVLFSLVFGEIGTPIGDMFRAFDLLMSVSSSNPLLQSANIEALVSGIIDIILVFLCFSVAKAAMKFLPFDNYKKTAAKKVGGKVLAVFIWMVIFVACEAITMTTIAYGDFNTDAIIAEVLANKDILIQLLLFTIGTKILGAVAQRHDYDNVQLASVKVAAPAAPIAPAEQAEAEVEVTEE